MDGTRAGAADRAVFVTGGAGFMGINLIRHLLTRGLSIVSFDIADFSYPERAAVKAVTGDIRNYETLRQAMQGAGVVVHCAAALPLYSAREIMSTEVEGTRKVLQAARENGISRVVHISSTAVYGTKTRGTTEEGEFEVFGPYAEAKILAERECRAYRQQGMCVPILRPKTFVGPERLGVWAILYDWAHSGSGFPLIGSGNNRYQLLDVDDLNDAVHAVMVGQPAIVNDTFNIGAKVFGTMKEDFQAVLDHAGHGRKVRPLPAWPVISMLKILERLRLSPVYEWVYETATADSYVSIEKAERVLGFRPRYSNTDALIRNFDWYVEHLPQIQQTSGVSHRVPWKQGLIGLGKKLF
jgi:nucleoside-diphosphate-sugar epimerase